MSLAELSPAFLYMVTEWTIRLGALLLVPLRRSPDSARAWLLLMLFLPVPGLIVYLLIGRPTYPRRRRARLQEATRLLEGAALEVAHSRACRRPVLSATFRQSERLIEKIGTFPALGDNRVDLSADYGGVVDALVGDIDAARHHVHLLMYIFADDPTGNRVIEALARAAARGVRCRVLIDAAGSRPWARGVTRRLRGSGIRVARSLPIAPWRRGSARADLRNHRKIVVIDGATGYIGSQNIVDAEAAKGVVNEELVARLAGPAVIELQAVFAVDWFLETSEVLAGALYFPHRAGPGATTAQIVPSGPDYGEAELGPLTVALVHAARERVVITTPYFIPDAALLQALRTAVLRGIAVDLILPSVSDNRFVRLAQQSYYSELLESGVRLHLYKERFLHAKHLSIDDEIVLIGSSNVDVRSFVLNAEVTLVVYGRATALALRAHQERCLAASEHLRASQWASRPVAAKLAENIARLVGPLL